MTTRTTCPATDRLRALVEGSLSPADQAELTDHLEACETCQRRIEELAAAADEWAVAARHAGAAVEPVPANLLANGPAAAGANPEDPAGPELPADFLDPPDRPGVLGRFGTYDVLEVTGRGGMGIVLKAFDQTLQRVVAIKVLAPQLAAAAAGRKRFLREARAAAAVRDQHVVDIHAVGEHKGLPFLVMEFVSGISLEQKIEASVPVPVPEVLRIGIQTAAGLAAAHAHGLIHRDVKPANILLENGVERVKITDFGLARVADDASLTQSGVISGTPMYMAPEQARGEAVDHRADLFSLGSVLYALCTGEPPFRAAGNMAALKRVCDDTPRPIRELNPDVPDWLVAVIAKLHAKDPAARFQTAREVADLLAGYLAHLQGPTQVPMPAFAPTRKPGRGLQRRWLAAAVFGLLLIAAVIAGRPGRWWAREGAAGGGTGGGTPAEEVVQVQLRTTLRGHKSTVHYLAYDPAGKILASAGANGDNLIRLWDTATDQEVGRLDGHRDHVVSVAIAPDGNTLASTSWDGTVRLWRIDTRAEIARFDYPPIVWTAAFSPDGKMLASGDDTRVRLWDVDVTRAADPVRERGAPLEANGPVRSLAFAPDGKTLAVLIGWGTEHNVQFWDVDRGERRGAPRAHVDGANGVAFTSDSRLMATGSLDRTIKLWDVAAGTELDELTRHRKQIHCVAVSPDDRLLASGDGVWQRPDEPGEVIVWDLRTRQPLLPLRDHQGCVFAVAFSPDGRTLATGSTDKTIKLWSVTREPAK